MMNVNTISEMLESLGMQKTPINNIADFESYLINRKAHIKSLKNAGFITDTIVTVINEGGIIASGSVRFIDIDTATGFGFTITALNGIKTKFTYTPDCTVYVKNSIVEQWD